MGKKERRIDQPSILLLPPTLEQIERLVEPLNTEFARVRVPAENGWRLARVDCRPVQRELRRLVQAWRDSGPNVSKLLSSHPVLARESNHLRARFTPTNGSYGRLTFMAESKELSPIDPLAIALGLFFGFLLNPYNVHLSGPCKHCGRYFVRRSGRRRVYCSKRCGLKHTSQMAIQKKRGQEKDEKVQRVLRLIEVWRMRKRRQDWKEWVAGYPEITKNWITRAVRAGLIVPPVKPDQSQSKRGSAEDETHASRN
jgi:Family of unknown function (DUF6076)